MAIRRTSHSDSELSQMPPATTSDGMEAQAIAAAVDLAARQMREGTASAQVITHYLKLGSSRETLEQERLRAEVALLNKKIESMASAERVEELYSKAITSMRAYGGDEAAAQELLDG